MTDKGTLNETEWQNLLELIKIQKCTPFIGAGACSGTLPLAKQIARRWASDRGYPLSDAHDLARVAQFLAIDDYPMRPKFRIRDEIEEIERRAPPDFSKSDEPHAVLADLNLPMYITTNYDGFMVKALESRNKPFV